MMVDWGGGSFRLSTGVLGLILRRYVVYVWETLCVSHAMELKARGIRQSTLYSSTYRDDVGVKARVSFHLVLLTQAVN